MKKLLSFLFLICIISCSPLQYVQLYEANSETVDLINNDFYFENDTIKVSYFFWTMKGEMGCAIENKLDQPIYLDSKKTAFIKNDIKYDIVNMGEKRSERIMFIPPNSTSIQTYSYNIGDRKLYSKPPNKKNTMAEWSFNESSSPLKFRNYFVFSLNENFNEEIHIDHDFFISNIQVWNSPKHDFYKTRAENMFYFKKGSQTSPTKKGFVPLTQRLKKNN